jgi:hypothetical protein
MLPQKFSAATTWTVPELSEAVVPHAVSVVRSSRSTPARVGRRAERRDDNTRSSFSNKETAMNMSLDDILYQYYSLNEM